MIVSTNPECKEELRWLSLRATPGHIGTLKLLESSNKPVDVQTMISYLEKNRIETDPATVFRIVNVLAEKGLVRPVQLNEGKTRYEVSSDEDHHHLICTNCGRIEDVSDSFMLNLEKRIEKEKEFHIKSHALEFYGLCKNCQN